MKTMNIITAALILLPTAALAKPVCDPYTGRCYSRAEPTWHEAQRPEYRSHHEQPHLLPRRTLDYGTYSRETPRPRLLDPTFNEPKPGE